MHFPVRRLLFVGRNYHPHVVETGGPVVCPVVPGDRIEGRIEGVGQPPLAIGSSE
jgi:hypothetical protein